MKDCLETINSAGCRHYKELQAKFKVDLESFKHKLESTSQSLNLEFDTLNGEVQVAMTRVEKLDDEVSKLVTYANQAYERLLLSEHRWK